MDLDRLLHDIEEEVKAITLTQHSNGNDIQGFNGNLVKKRLKNQKGDLSFHTVLDSTASESRPSPSLALVESWEAVPNKRLLYVKLSRAQVILQTLQAVLKRDCSFMVSLKEPDHGQHQESAVVHGASKESACSISTYRCQLLSLALQKFMTKFKRKMQLYFYRDGDGDSLESICIARDFDKVESINDMENMYCNKQLLLHKDFADMLNKSSHTYNSDEDSSSKVDENSKDLEISLVQLRDSKGPVGYVKTLKDRESLLVDGKYSRIFKTASCLWTISQITISQSISAETCPQCLEVIHLVPTKNLHHLQTSSLVSDAGFQQSTVNTKQRFCTYDDGMVQNTQERHNSVGCNASGWFSICLEELTKSYKMKYGSQVNGPHWEKTIYDVGLASFKLDILSSPLNSKVKLNFDPTAPGNSSRNGLFILYNYARLHKLLEHYQEQVDEGVYPPLPDWSSIDFKLLSQDAEWDLVLRYILFYPVLLKKIHTEFITGDRCMVKLNFHKIVQFLFDLSHDLSSYYHQTKVLLEPRPHLSSLMFSRLGLMIAIKKVMEDCFDILGIVPPTQM